MLKIQCKVSTCRSIVVANSLILMLVSSGCQFLCLIFRCSTKQSRAIDWEECANKIQPRKELQGKAREVAYQADINRACMMTHTNECKVALAARRNVDSFTAAVRLVAGAFTPAQYLAISRDRTRKLWATETKPQRAAKLCTGNDADEDFVPDDEDKCPNTPELTTTDDQGCPDNAVPAGPSADDVRKILEKLHIMASPGCQGAPRPGRISGYAKITYESSSGSSRQSMTLSAEQPANQPASCRVWYQFEIQDPSNLSGEATLSAVFMENEGSNRNNPGQKGSKTIEFTALQSDPGTRGSIAQVRATSEKPSKVRVRAINGNGHRGPWSIWFPFPVVRVLPAHIDFTVAPAGQ